MKKYKLLTLGIGSILAASTSAITLVSCSESHEDADQNDDIPIPSSQPIPPAPLTPSTPLVPGANIGPSTPLVPGADITPGIPLEPGSNITPSTPIPPSNTDVTSNFKTGVWTLPSDPSYQRRYFIWQGADGKTGIPPTGDYVFNFSTVDLQGYPISFSYVLHIDAQTGMIARSASRSSEDGKTKFMINYAGENAAYPETSGQIYLDYLVSGSHWWPYGATTSLRSVTKIDTSSPRAKATSILNKVSRDANGLGYSLTGENTLKPNKLYTAKVQIDLYGQYPSGGKYIDTVTMDMSFLGTDSNISRVYNYVYKIQSKTGIHTVSIYPDGVRWSNRRLFDLSSTGKIADFQLLSLNEIDPV